MPRKGLLSTGRVVLSGIVLLGLVIGLSLFAIETRAGALSALDLNLCGSLPVGSTLADGTTLTAAQAANAQVIVQVAEAAGAGAQGAIDALTAALTESRLRNDHYGLGGALGLFQETPADGWGTPAEVENPIYATDAFLERLLSIPGWQALPPATAAQAVERSAYPGRYQAWVTDATDLAAGLLGTGTCTNAEPPLAGATTSIPAGYQLPAGPPQVVTAISYTLAQLGKPYEWGGTGPNGYDCSGLVMMAYRAAGIDLPRTTYQQVDAGQPASLADLQPGDLLFTEGTDPGPGGLPGHVGMYIGDGLVIDAPETGHPIELTPLTSWTGQIVAIRQIVP